MRLRSVAVALSGGVDSAVAASLLKRRGFDVVGVFMRNWDEAASGGECGASTRDLEDARWSADRIKIEFRVVDFVKEFWNDVFAYLLSEYQSGRTPNPDMMCNREIKFAAFLNFARESLGVDAIATGHYVRSSAGPFLENLAQLERKGEKVVEEMIKLLRGADVSKDQSFFLSQIRQESLRHSMFPIGSLWKKEVKEMARSLGLSRLAKKKESMGVCFVDNNNNNNFGDFILDFLPPSPGDIRLLENPSLFLGRHRGLHTLTVGQRLRLPRRRLADIGLGDAADQGLFVAERCVETNAILAVPGTRHPALFADGLEVETPRWICGRRRPEFVVDEAEATAGDVSAATVDFQYNNSVPDTRLCVISVDGAGLHRVRLSSPFRAITPGQFAVFYRGDEVLGAAKTLRATKRAAAAA